MLLLGTADSVSPSFGDFSSTFGILVISTVVAVVLVLALAIAIAVIIDVAVGVALFIHRLAVFDSCGDAVEKKN